MKLIDQTPFFNEKGEISLMDRAKAFMDFGRSWLAEMEAQRSILPVLEKNLDNKFTLLRNVKPPDLDAPIPFILVGPTGIYVIYVTPVLGMFRAKGDQWGTISGNIFKSEKTNLLTRTERMARAVQIHMQRQGYTQLTSVESVLLCANPGVHVDSLRPIVRVIMRDAVERFAVSIAQARVVFSADDVYDIVNRIINPPATKDETPAPVSPDPQYQPEESQAAFTPESQAAPFQETEPQAAADAWMVAPESMPALEPEVEPSLPVQETPSAPRQKKVSRKQWLFLILMMLFWCALVGVFLYFIITDLYL